MTTLAPKLPWQHAFAGGYPGRGGQSLPTDPDAIDYLERLAAADGAPVEVGVAQAIDAFVKGCKADASGVEGRSNWDAIKASCILCGARTLTGALVPLVGTAPTPYNFTSSDYNRGLLGTDAGLKGDGSTTYLDSGRANDADGQNDNHNAVHVTAAHTAGSTGYYIDSNAQSVGDNNLGRSGVYTNLFVRNRTQTGTTVAKGDATGFVGHSRASSTEYTVRAKAGDDTIASTSESPSSGNLLLFARPAVAFSDARLAFYSIGSSLSLSSLDTRVSNLVNSIKFTLATGLNPAGYEPETIAYILSGYENGGSL